MSTLPKITRLPALLVPAAILLSLCVPARADIPIGPLYSIAAEDGWVRGAPLALTFPSGDLRIGDDGQNRQAISILSFDTGSVLPDGAVIVSAELRLTRESAANAPPLLGTAAMFVKTGAFSGNAALENSDLSDVAGVTAAGPLEIPSLDGDTSTSILSPAGAAAINTTGLTQIRLAYPIPTDFDIQNSHYEFFSGENAMPDRRPTLFLTYVGPTPTPTASPTRSPTPTASPSPSPSPSATPGPTATASPSPTPGPTASPSATPQPTATDQNSALDWMIYE